MEQENNEKKEIEFGTLYDINKNIVKQNEIKLSAEITKLQDDEYLARYAKEKFMLSSDGDTIIKWN